MLLGGGGGGGENMFWYKPFCLLLVCWSSCTKCTVQCTTLTITHDVIYTTAFFFFVLSVDLCTSPRSSVLFSPLLSFSFFLGGGVLPWFVCTALPCLLFMRLRKRVRTERTWVHTYPVPFTKKSATLNSFLPRAIILWNTLSFDVQSSLGMFKSKLSDLCPGLIVRTRPVGHIRVQVSRISILDIRETCARICPTGLQLVRTLSPGHKSLRTPSKTSCTRHHWRKTMVQHWYMSWGSLSPCWPANAFGTSTECTSRFRI